jgi:hypothetical protein
MRFIPFGVTARKTYFFDPVEPQQLLLCPPLSMRDRSAQGASAGRTVRESTGEGHGQMVK